MPVLYKGNKKEDEQQKKPGSVVGQTGAQVLGGASQGDLGTGGVSQDSGPKKTSSGSFTNLQAYLEAGKGQNFGQEVAGKVRNTLGEARAAGDTDRSRYGGDVTNNTTNYDENYITGTINDPSDINMQKWGSYFDAGSTKVPTYQQSTEYSQAHKKGQDYAGMATDPSQRSTLVGDDWLGTGAEATKLEAEAINQATQDSTRGVFDDAVNTVNTNIDTGLENANTEYGNLQGLMTAMNTGDITPEQATALGLDPNLFGDAEGLRTFGVQSGGYFDPGSGDPTRSQAMTQAQFDRLQALNTLGGGSLASSMPGMPDQVGSYAPGSFQADNYLEAIGDRNTAYQTNMKTPSNLPDIQKVLEDMGDGGLAVVDPREGMNQYINRAPTQPQNLEQYLAQIDQVSGLPGYTGTQYQDTFNEARRMAQAQIDSIQQGHNYFDFLK